MLVYSDCWRQGLAMEITAKVQATTSPYPAVKCQCPRYPQSAFRLSSHASFLLAISMPSGDPPRQLVSGDFLFRLAPCFSGCAVIIHGGWQSSLKLAPSSVPYGLSRGSVRWGAFPRFAAAADRNLLTQPTLSSFAIPKTRAVPPLILAHAIVSQLRSLALGRGG